MNNRRITMFFSMMGKWTILLILLGLSGLQSVYGQQQVARVLDGNPYIGGYYEYLPADYTSNTSARYPLLVFFHGLGEEGNGTTDISRVLRNGPPKLINAGTFPKTFTVNGQTFSFIVISPQTKTLADNKSILQFINTLKEKYRVDESRIYLTGLSKGGWQVWQWASGGDSYAQLPAAIVPVCGAMDPYYDYVAAPIARNNLPVWATHNDMDPTVNVVNTYNWIKFINAYVPACNPQAKMTIFNSASHDAWTKTYDPNFRENGLNIYEWMLQYKTSAVNPPVPPPPTGGPKRITLAKNFGNGINYPNAMTQLNILPGDTLCIPAGDYSSMVLGNITGTPEKPVVIQNCGGLVRFGINNTAAGGTITVNFSTCKYIEFSGSGTPGLEYGFDIKGSNDAGASQFGVYFLAGSSDFDVHNLYIHDAGIFIVAKTLQACNNPQYQDGNFTMRNVKIHKIKGRNSEWEGFYIGNTHYILTAAETGCGDLRSHRLENVDVYDNDLENMGQDGIQLSLADKGNNKIRNNRVVNYGTSQNVQHSYGILVGGGSKLDVFNNRVDKGFSANICVFGSGINRVFNNVLTNSGIEGILVADRLVFEPTTAYIYNNTILNSKDHAITIFGTQTTLGHKVYNNLSIKETTIYDAPIGGYYIKGDNIKHETINNLNYATVAEAGFVNAAAGDYHLLATSKAIDAGRDMTDQGLTTDYDYKPRPNNGKFDIGAFEYNGGAPPPNAVPVANAGTGATITLPADSVLLDGSTSTDADGTITGWSWTKTSGPAAGTIATPTAAKTMVRGLTEGTYVFSLKVTDNAGATATANVTVVVKAAPVANKAPVANAGNGITITLPTNSIQLDGSASTDPDGSITTWSWTKKSGPAATIGTPNAAKTPVTGMAEGVYVFVLTVTDNASATATAEVTVTVNGAPAGNTAPVAHAGFNSTIILPASSAQLDGSASQDLDGTIVSYAWKQLGGPAGVTIASPAAAKTQVNGFTLEGAYVFELTVTDDKGAVNSSNVTVTVTKSTSTNKAPVANAGAAQTITLPASVVTVDGSASTDADGNIVAYKWTKVSGSPGGNITSSTAAKTTIYDLYIAGEYYYQLRVTDNAGDTASALVKIVVNLPANNPPVARAGNDITITLPTNSVVLDGSTSTDPDGNLATFLWKKTGGPAAGTINAPGSASTAVSGLEAGTYEFELTVTDKAGAASSDKVLVTVNAAAKPANKPPVARAGNNSAITLPTSSVSLDGRSSTDEDGTIASYHWRKVSGPAAGTISTPDGNYTTVTGLTAAGTYVYELTVQDNSSASSTAQVSVTVNPAVVPDNQAPVAATQGDVILQLPNATTTFNGSASSDPDGSVAGYEWKQLSGPNNVQIWEPGKSKSNVTGFDRGEYIFQLTVRDDRGSTNVTSFKVSVLADKNGTADTAGLMPNPATTYTRLDMIRKGTHQVNVYILELSGRVVRQIPASFIDRLQMTIDVQDVPKGIYLISVKGKGVNWSSKLMVAGQ